MSFWGERRFDEESIKQRSTRVLIPCASVLCSFCRGWLCRRHGEWTSEVLLVIVKMGAEQKNVAGMWRNSTSGAPFLRTQGPAVVGQVLRADYILSVIRQAVLKETGRGATVPAALKFIPQYAAAAISLCWTPAHENKKGARCQLFIEGLGETFARKLSCAPVRPCLQNKEQAGHNRGLTTIIPC